MYGNAGEEENAIEDAIKDAIKSSGKINILIAGKTGVGKSTLINTVFRGELAKTGSGKPVTQQIEEVEKKGHPLTIIDSKGLELADYKTIISELECYVKERNLSYDENNHIHVAWLCIAEGGDRVEQAEIDLCEMLNKLDIPVVVVLTKSTFVEDSTFFKEMKNLLPTAKSVVRVRAIPEHIYDEETGAIATTRKVRGIDDLIADTGKLLPEAKKRAYANALSSKHTAALKAKVEQAEKEVLAAAALAAGAGAAPIPFSDAFFLVPIQVGMLARIGITFGMEVSTTALTTLVTSIIGAGGASLLGRAIVSGVLKMIPGGGSALGGVIAAGTASMITKTLGSTYIAVLADFCKENPGVEVDISTIVKDLKRRIKL